MADIFSKERGYFLGCNAGDVKNEVIVAGVVSRGVGDGLYEGVATTVDAVYEFIGLLGRYVAGFSHTSYAVLPVGNDEQMHGIGVIAKDMETGAADDDAALLCGKFT